MPPSRRCSAWRAASPLQWRAFGRLEQAHLPGLSTPLEHPASPSASEVECKRLLRPSWDLQRWKERELFRRPWPAPLPQANICPQRVPAVQERGGPALDLAWPAILEGALDTWPAVGQWTLANLLQEYRDTDFVVGAALDSAENADQAKHIAVTMALREYCEYAQTQQDDCPLYIFDDAFLESGNALAASYARPTCLAEDLMDVLGPGLRVPYRGLLIGAERSGTSMHVDVLETSAWNTLVSGRKRWVLFPPCTAAWLLRGTSTLGSEEGVYESAADWFLSHYPMLDVQECVFQDFFQSPGETVYVPRGWWHCVVNLEFSIAVTENFVSRRDLPFAFELFRRTEPHIARHWFDALCCDPRLQTLTTGLERT